MRDLIVTENITLDGVIEASGDWFDVADTDDHEFMAVQEEHRNGADAVLLGRETYESFAGYWPLQTDDETGVTDYLDRTEKYVVSDTLSTPTWEHTTVLRGPLAEAVTALKEGPGQAIVATGSITLVHALVQAGLVDEYRLLVFPVVLGRGRRLFEDATDVPPLQLVEARSFRSGIALLRYRTT